MPRQTGRRKAMEQALKENGFPFEAIHIWSKIEECSTQYASNSDLMRAAVADGFPIFQEWMSDSHNVHKYRPIGVIGHTWSIFRIWRDAGTAGMPFMFLHDDWLPTKPFDFYVRLTEAAEKHSQGQWKVIALNGKEDDFFWDRTVNKPVRNHRERTYIGSDQLLVGGLPNVCGDVGMIFSPVGVEWLRSHFERRFWFIEALFYNYPNETDTYTVSEECLKCIQNRYPSTIHKNGKNRYPEKLDEEDKV